MNWEIRHGDCLELMADLEPNSVGAIVTSPPYADQRKYAGGDDARVTERANRNGRRPGSKNQSRKQRAEAPMLFAESFPPYLKAMARVLSPAGSLMLNLGVVMRNGEESPYADCILDQARRLGWKLLQRIVWNKPNGNTLSDSRFLRINHEWVFWLAKSTDAYRGYDRITRTPHAPDTLRRIRGPYKHNDDERYQKRSGKHPLHPDGARPTTIFTAGVGGGSGIRHPAPMAHKLARHLVALSAPEGALVLDPFAGSCTTGVAALELGRHFLGMEIEQGYIAEARERVLDAAGLLATEGLGL